MREPATLPIDDPARAFLSFPEPARGRRQGLEEIGVAGDPRELERLAAIGAAQRPYPLRAAKIECPGLPEETLRRDRLLGWLEARIGRRVIFVVAEAGFGKTTLLADFARRSRLRTIWYRLDDDDRDATGFLRYLVAACQELDPGLVPRTAALLASSASGPVGWDTVLETLLGELEPVAATPTIVVFDDYYLGEQVPEIPRIVERLLAKAPERLGFVFLSRRTPALAVARLRARDEIAELGRDELRFDAAETESLFRDTYHLSLEPDVLRDVQRRTDGWAASLQLVKAAVGEHSREEVRSIVRSLSAAEGELYDYLAEEVVGELDDGLRSFLMRIALLEELEPERAAVAAGVTTDDARQLLEAAQRLGFISRGSRGVRLGGLHPLVREFLVARLRREIGDAGLAELHRTIARSHDVRSWRLAATHWAAAGEPAEVRRVIAAATSTILGTGDYATAHDFISRFPDPNPNPWFDILLTRWHASQGRYEEARRLAERAATKSAETSDPDTALLADLNERFVCQLCGIRPRQRPDASSERNDVLAAIWMANTALLDATEDGEFSRAETAMLRVLDLATTPETIRFRGITLLNLAGLSRGVGDFQRMLDLARQALPLLCEAGTLDERAVCELNIGTALAHAGDWPEALRHLDQVQDLCTRISDSEVLSECAGVHLDYGDPEAASKILASIPPAPTAIGNPHQAGVRSRAALLEGDLDTARSILADVKETTAFNAGHKAEMQCVALRLAIQDGATQARVLAKAILELTSKQGAWHWWKNARTASATLATGDDLSAMIEELDDRDRVYLTLNAELIARRLGDLTPGALAVVKDESVARPQRWRLPLRRATASKLGDGTPHVAAELLEDIGTADDIPLLRSLADVSRSPDGKALGLRLIRAVAPPVYVEDLGRVTVLIGNRRVLGTALRRRVLSLLCILLTRSQLSAPRDEILDALWPEQDPTTASNSLNQTAYFLRRVFEPSYSERATAGYLHHENEVVWLDPALVASRSGDCLRLLDRVRRGPSADLVLHLSELYSGRFALDFAYDDWASPFRDSLHSAYLRCIHGAVEADARSGAYDRGIALAQRALSVDPDNDEIELQLVRLYRLVGAHSAAAEQYAHYASVLRGQLGLEPPPLEAM